jgi:hypothetical protein
MPDWTYTLQDFLLFSPRVYWRLFALHNHALWPLHVPALLIGASIPLLVSRHDRQADRAVAAILAAAWLWVGWSFLWHRYAAINWAAGYAALLFAVEALLLVWISIANGLSFAGAGIARRAIGLGLFLFALGLHPFLPIWTGRTFETSASFGIAPDPTVIATLGLLCMASAKRAWVLFPIPILWCISSWATLRALDAPDQWLPLTAAAFTILARLVPEEPKLR